MEMTWVLRTDGMLIISGTGAMSNYTNSSGTPWEARKSSIKTVVVSEGAEAIGDYAFNGCTNLTDVTLPGSLRTIGNNAFSSCSSIETIILPEGITTIESYAFSNCDKMTTISLPDSLESLEYDAFYSCDVLGSITIPNNVASIGNRTFSYCRNLSEVILPDSLDSIPERMFYSCGLNEIAIPEGVTTIGQNAFYGNSSLTALYLPSMIENIASSAFGNCGSLSDVYYPGTQAEAVQIQIGTGNTTLSEAVWYYGYVHIWRVEYTWAADNSEVTATRTCSWHADETETETISAEAQVTIAPTQNVSGLYCYVSMPFENQVFEKQTKVISAIPALEEMDTMQLPDGLLTIEAEAFSGLRCEAVIILSGCTTILSNAFSNCKNLIYVSIPQSVTTISEDAFNDCDNVIIYRQQ